MIANLHWFPDAIRGPLRRRLGARGRAHLQHEEELLGTAGGVRNVADFLGDESFLVMAGDALTDIDLAAIADVHERTTASRPWPSSGSPTSASSAS